jgi:hypothetical protein
MSARFRIYSAIGIQQQPNNQTTNRSIEQQMPHDHIGEWWLCSIPFGGRPRRQIGRRWRYRRWECTIASRPTSLPVPPTTVIHQSRCMVALPSVAHQYLGAFGFVELQADLVAVGRLGCRASAINAIRTRDSNIRYNTASTYTVTHQTVGYRMPFCHRSGSEETSLGNARDEGWEVWVSRAGDREREREREGGREIPTMEDEPQLQAREARGQGGRATARWSARKRCSGGSASGAKPLSCRCRPPATASRTVAVAAPVTSYCDPPACSSSRATLTVCPSLPRHRSPLRLIFNTPFSCVSRVSPSRSRPPPSLPPPNIPQWFCR